MLPTQPILRALVGLAEPQPIPYTDVPALARWLIQHELGPLAHHLYRTAWPALAKELQEDVFMAIAENSLLLHHLDHALQALNGAAVPTLLLKGTAVAHTVYPHPHLRLMSDVDILVPTADLNTANDALQQAGFIWTTPPQKLAKTGQAEYARPGWVKGGIDLQATIFPGYWLRYTARGDNTAVWNRRQPLTVQGQPTHTLAPEDALLHATIHMAINHQLDGTTLRGMVDMLRLARYAHADWAIVHHRARQWRVHTVWQFIANLMADLWGADALPHTPLPSWRQTILRRFVAPHHLLTHNPLQEHPRRFLFLLALVDGVGSQK